MNTKTTIKFPKFYVCKYGVFYEYEQLEHYCVSDKNYYYVNDVILEKFIVHYKNYEPCLYFRFRDIDKKQLFTLPVEHLGIFYRKKRKKYCK